MPKVFKAPSYRLHKPTGQAVVTVRLADGTRKDVYLGPHGSPGSHAEYARVIGELAANFGRMAQAGPPPADLAVVELIARFREHADRHYRLDDGSPSSEIHNYKLALRYVRELYGHTPAAEFGPLALKAVRQRMIAAGWCRKQINGHVGRVRRVWKWGVENELVPAATLQALQSVAGLQKGRSGAKEREPVKPVAAEHVRATLPFLNRHVRGLVEFQRLTGCRPGEACAVRRCDIDTAGDVWLYRPARHKLAYRGKPRVIPIGPRAQSLLREFFTADPAAYLFSPRLAVDEYRAARAAARKTPRYPANERAAAAKRKRKPQRVPSDRYKITAYENAVARGVEKANRRRAKQAGEGNYDPIPRWHPNQLRHGHGTAVRQRYGLEAAQVILGHSRADVTQVYAERDEALAVRVAKEVG